MIARARFGMAVTADLNGSGIGDALRTPLIACRAILASSIFTATMSKQWVAGKRRDWSWEWLIEGIDSEL
jgi:hypothetical protein